MGRPARVVVVLALAFWPGCKQSHKQSSPPKPPPGVRADETAPIATVNGVALPPARFNLIVRARLAGMSRVLPDRAVMDVKLATANELVDDALVEQAARRRSVSISDKDVDAAMAALAATFRSREAFNRHVAAYPQQNAGLRAMLRSRLEREALAGIRADDPVSDADAQAYFSQHAAIYQVPAHLNAQEIVLKLPSGAKPAELQAVHAKAADLAAMAKNPKLAFSSLARNASEGASASSGGDLGVVTPTSIAPALWKVLDALKVGQSSGAIETPGELHILHLYARVPASNVTFKTARPGIDKAIRVQRRSSRINDLMQSLRKAAKIDNRIARQYAPPSAPTTGSSLAGLGSRQGPVPAALPKGPPASGGSL